MIKIANFLEKKLFFVEIWLVTLRVASKVRALFEQRIVVSSRELLRKLGKLWVLKLDQVKLIRSINLLTKTKNTLSKLRQSAATTVKIDPCQLSLSSVSTTSSNLLSSTFPFACFFSIFRRRFNNNFKKSIKFLQFSFSRFDFKLDGSFDSKPPVL